ncbi:ROK family transcriptional regulator [Rhizobium leguminosarum]|uniref:ROK family transcriptional regulator n=1 Tax=Rhizobium leguminosarum TaxID=384 RepID=UPI0024B336E8|nr:ROK family transcriptional regulator [Rhizobium leguminosarum]WHO82742.1 ROK family transcriptional regulator [Rhizobium leguminosarum]
MSTRPCPVGDLSTINSNRLQYLIKVIKYVESIQAWRIVRDRRKINEMATEMHEKGDPTEIRKANRRFILDILRREGSRSRVELAQATGLSGAAVTMLISDLMEDGLISEGPQQKSSGGRRPISLQIDYASRYSIGVKIMSRSIEAVLTDLATSPIRSMEIDIAKPTPENVAAACREIVNRLVPDAGERREKLVGMGLGLPGLIDSDKGVCIKSHRFDWDAIPIASLVEAAAEVPVWIDNDVNAYAIAQQLFGHGRAHNSIAVFIVGTGVGAAIIVNGRVLGGSSYAAGEIGFCRDPGEPPSAATWGERFSEPSLIERWSVIGDGTDLQFAADSANPEAVALLRLAGGEVGERLANLVMFVDPELVIVSGEAVRFRPHFTDAIRRGFERQYPLSKPELVIDWHPDYWARGAAALAIQSFFSRT